MGLRAERRTPERILLEMRQMNAAIYSAHWTDENDRGMAAVVIVDGQELAARLIAFAEELEHEP